MEVAELRRLLELGRAPSTGSGTLNGSSVSNNSFHNSLEEATELEYLRNILFEFMMGRQTAVSHLTGMNVESALTQSWYCGAQTLVKVVGAVVKFTPEQTRKIAEREEQRQSLVFIIPFHST